MTTQVIEIEQDEYTGDNCAIVGTSVFEITSESFFDADNGGTDGVEITSAKLLYVSLDGVNLDRDTVVKITSPAIIDAYEQSMIEGAAHKLCEVA